MTREAGTPAPRRSALARWVREPLVHFAVLGAGLFLLHSWRQEGPGDADADDRPTVEVTAGTIRSLTDRWARQLNRWPTPEEVQGLVDEHVREEILYREALALGLDRDDAIVRRRLGQKMEFLVEDVATPPVADAATLAAWFERNAARYARPARVSLRHVYFSRERRGEPGAEAARKALEALRSPGASDEGIGDPFLLESVLVDRSERELSDALGPEFAATAASAPIGSWAGPVESPYGVHLVNVSARTDRAPAAFEEVRDAVARDFQDERRREANRGVLERLRARYRVEIASPPPTPGAPAEPGR